MNAYMLKIRSGVEVDSYGKKAGKGALVSEELSMTLSVSQDQYLFQPLNDNPIPILDDQGGQQISVRTDGKSPTLRAETHGNVPCVMQESVIDVEMEVAVRKYPVDTEKLKSVLRAHRGTMKIKDIADALELPETQVAHWFRADRYFSIPEPEVWYPLKKLLGIETDEFDKAITEFEFKGGSYDMNNRIYTGEIAPTLTTGCDTHLHLLPQKTVTFEPGIAARDGGHIYEGVSGTLRANPGDNRMAICYAIDQQGGKGGANYAENVMPTLCSDSHGTPHAVAYSFDSMASNSMKSKNPYSGCREVEIAKTLDTTDPNPSKNQGGIAIVEAYSIENHPADSRVNIDESGKVQTLTSRMGTGGGNVPMVLEPFSKSRRAKSADDFETWKPGKVANTLNTFDQGDVRSTDIVVEKKPEIVNLNKGDVQSKTILDPDGIAPSLYAGECRGGGGEMYVLDEKPLCMATQQGGAEIMEDKCPTIIASAGMSGNNQPVICLQGNGIDRADTAGCNGKGWKEDICYTLNTIDRPAIAYLASGNDVTGCLMASGYDKLRAQEMFSGDYTVIEEHPMVSSEEVYCVDMGGGKSSSNIHEDMSPTLTCTHYGAPAVVFQQNQRNEVRVMEKAGAITAEAGMHNQNFLALAIESHPQDSRVKMPEKNVNQPLSANMEHDPSNGGLVLCMETFHCTTEENMTQPLKARDWKDPLVIAIDRAAFNQGQNALYDFTITDKVMPTLVARGPNAVCYWNGEQVTGTLTANNAGGAQRMPDKGNFNCIIEEKPMDNQYIVRRLTPTECCRLQGFPDGWGEIDEKEDLTDEEYKFWYEVRNTHAAINGKKQKAYTKKQMLAWYNSLHTDSSEYKMWGNGIALPTALYVMEGIAEALEEQERTS